MGTHFLRKFPWLDFGGRSVRARSREGLRLPCARCARRENLGTLGRVIILFKRRGGME